MKLRYLLIAVAALVLQAPASEGKRWWSHIEFLADDALAGRNVGSAAFEKAATYVEGQFKEIGLRPGGVSGYRQPVKFESRVLVPEQSKLALLSSGVEEPLTPREDAVLSARGELDGSIEAPMVFVGYGLSIPEAKWDELAGLDLHGKIAVYVNTIAPVDVSDNVKSHVGSAAERWAVLKKAGAIGVATFPNPRPPAGTTADVGLAGAVSARDAAPIPPPTVVLADRDRQEQAGQIGSITMTRRGAGKCLAGSGHTIDELDQLIADKKPLPRFPLVGRLRVHAAVKRESIDSANIIGIYEGSDPHLKTEYVVMSAHLDHVGIGRPVNGDSIYNGAMDDASGVASMIEIARLLKT